MAAGSLAPTYATPRAASAAYQAGLLKSDSNISSHHPAIRLAFRYLSVGDGDGTEDLFLCYVHQNGTPYHFRRLRPRRSAATATTAVTDAAEAAPAEEAAHGNLRGTSRTGKPSSSTARAPLVDESDHIETTRPGHAFVFCRRVESEPGRGAKAQNQGDPIVVHEDGSTYFLRQAKRGEEEGAEDWESYLVVGGFRPGPKAMDSEEEESGSATVGEGNTDDNEESSKEQKEDNAEDSDDESDDDSSREGGPVVQLVTIRPARKNPTASGNKTTSSEEAEDDDLCSNCLYSIPFLRGVVNTKRRGASNFVATENTVDLVDAPADGPALEVTVGATRLDPTPVDTSAKHYDRVVLGGWPCRTEPGCFPPGMDSPATGTNRLRARFEADLRAATAALPAHAVEKLRGSTPIWINKSQRWGPKVAPVRGRHGCFHPGPVWLVRNGMSPAKCGGVEWYDAVHYLVDCDFWGSGGVMLHELSHAWHCLHVEKGYDNEDVISVYKQAMEEGLYECVPVHGPQGPQCKAYACQDQMEYFAELSVAFLGGLDDEKEHNKWYPFNRKQLRDHDPRAFAMLCRIWGVEAE